jgi:hypothetical protein
MTRREQVAAAVADLDDIGRLFEDSTAAPMPSNAPPALMFVGMRITNERAAPDYLPGRPTLAQRGLDPLSTPHANLLSLLFAAPTLAANPGAAAIAEARARLEAIRAEFLANAEPMHTVRRLEKQLQDTRQELAKVESRPGELEGRIRRLLLAGQPVEALEADLDQANARKAALAKRQAIIEGALPEARRVARSCLLGALDAERRAIHAEASRRALELANELMRTAGSVIEELRQAEALSAAMDVRHTLIIGPDGGREDSIAAEMAHL